ncbi:hypothetical protein KAU32_06675 [bacterium]|nr:hypothetical protein [bacterium]
MWKKKTPKWILYALELASIITNLGMIGILVYAKEPIATFLIIALVILLTIVLSSRGIIAYLDVIFGIFILFALFLLFLMFTPFFSKVDQIISNNNVQLAKFTAIMTAYQSSRIGTKIFALLKKPAK